VKIADIKRCAFGDFILWVIRITANIMKNMNKVRTDIGRKLTQLSCVLFANMVGVKVMHQKIWKIIISVRTVVLRCGKKATAVTEKERRNRLVYIDRERGMLLKEIAEMRGLSVSRVSMIITEEKRRIEGEKFRQNYKNRKELLEYIKTKRKEW